MPLGIMILVNQLFGWGVIMRLAHCFDVPFTIKNFKLWTLIKLGFLMLVLVCTFFCLSGHLRGQAYVLFREVSRIALLLRTSHMHSLESEHFLVRYSGGEKVYAKLVLKTAEKFYDPIASQYSFSSKHKIPIIMYANGSALNASFGWSANESAIGVYWAGAIRVLSPLAWMGEREIAQMENVFMTSGPVVHELTHLAVDYATQGNYTRWFTEGLAQYEEYRMTGFRFEKPLFEQGQLYSLAELDQKFDHSAEQALAYYQSFSLVEYMMDRYGRDSVDAMIDKLKKGSSMEEALENILNQNIKDFEHAWLQWLQQD